MEQSMSEIKETETKLPEVNAKTWLCSSNLRWYRPKGASVNELTLQQAWVVRETNEIEWRGIPLVLEE